MSAMLLSDILCVEVNSLYPRQIATSTTWSLAVKCAVATPSGHTRRPPSTPLQCVEDPETSTRPTCCPTPIPSGSVSAESYIMEAASQLTSLRSLCLRTNPYPNNITPQALAPYATSAAHLSALTGLTSLVLQTTHCYACFPDSWALRHDEGDRHEAWVEVREAHRTAVLSALHAMPRLQHLNASTLWLRPPELAPLTALTCLGAGGLLPPLPPPHGAGAAGGPAAGPAAARGGAAGEQPNARAWPPQLQTLVLGNGGSPRALAALELPSALRRFACWALCIGMSDVDEHGCMQQETINALGPAVQLISRPETICGEDTIEVSVDGSPHPMHSRQATPSGQVEWLQQLAGLGAFSGIKLVGYVALRAGDVAFMVRMWPNVRVRHNGPARCMTACGRT